MKRMEQRLQQSGQPAVAALKSEKVTIIYPIHITGESVSYPYGIYMQAGSTNKSKALTDRNTSNAIKAYNEARRTVSTVEPAQGRVITFTPEVYQQIVSSIGAFPAEQGGMLGSSDGGKTIDHYYWDRQASTSCATYSPNVELINNKILPEWNANGVRLVGFVHSHPKGCTQPSSGDVIYARQLLKALNEERFFLPIVQNDDSGSFKIYGYAAESGSDDMPVIRHYEIHNMQQSSEIARTGQSKNLPIMTSTEFHSRVEKVYPLSVMRRKTVIVPGCGGAGEYVENIARTGVGKIILLDGDEYGVTNLATQSVYLDEIGKNKALALKARIARIDPDIQVVAIPRFLDDKTTDRKFEKIVGPQLMKNPSDILMTACTDSFPAQARCARLAMKYGMPFMAAQLYEKGLAAEIIFTYPGITPACPRCMLASRYDAYLKEGYKNSVGSHQTPIFATCRTNALKGYVSLMLLLYHEVKDNTFYDLLEQVKDRNFINIRMSRNFDSPIFERELGKSPYTCFDETLWMTQIPDNGENGSPLCPECQGKGNLKLLTGLIGDTRKIV